ncbi:uncharacterized protein BP5553_07679 [Venustampulla echinocandica]|uniref:Large ribosomal subunit protein mL59 domain-containing protein n=1 Tax=Venustampulla echinocandica TaxID=2656787 RepID=A0A370TH76_9HELO|nr:uncharacterized protein BP5553_07679 [Venustampulla echinocandica]RDL34551.1 hypothetical protein BP5553_07679 [Venustampulla echinocandica]
MRPQQYRKLAESLPPRLTRFFARYPPQAIVSASDAAPSNTSPSASAAPSADQDAANAVEGFQNPFRTQKHPITGRWHDPKYSLRRQADLVKLARQNGVEELLPFTVKGTEERLRKRMENGLRVKGTGIGQRVKGKESERTLKGRGAMVVDGRNGRNKASNQDSGNGIRLGILLYQYYTGCELHGTGVRTGTVVQVYINSARSYERGSRNQRLSQYIITQSRMTV